MAAGDQEALERLSGIADLFLAHDREIENRCDDSVARVIAGKPTVFRRSRGYVPRAVPLRRPVRRPVLACGAHLKNTFCLAAGDEAWLGPHVGDLDNLEATRAFEEQVERLQRFLGIRPEVIAHDLHPDYASTAVRARAPGAGQGRGAAPPRPRHERGGRARSRGPGPRPGLGRDGLRDGRDGLGRGAAARPRAAPSSGWPRCARCGSPAATRRSGRSGASPSRRSTTPSAARRRSSGCGCSTRCPPATSPSSGRWPPGGSTRRSPTAPAGTSTRSARWGSPGRGPPTRGRWRWSGTSPPTRPRAAPYPST